MKHTFIIMAIMLCAFVCNSQSLADITGQQISLFNAMAIAQGIEPIDYTVTQFRKDVVIYAESVGIPYYNAATNGYNNVAILHADSKGYFDNTANVQEEEVMAKEENASQDDSTSSFNSKVLAINDVPVIAIQGTELQSDDVCVAMQLPIEEERSAKVLLDMEQSGVKRVTTLLDLYIDTRHDIREMRRFEWIWRRVQEQLEGMPNEWHDVGLDRYSTAYWQYYWLTYDKGLREEWIVAVGDRIMIQPTGYTAGGGVVKPAGLGRKENPYKSNCKAASKLKH